VDDERVSNELRQQEPTRRARTNRHASARGFAIIAIAGFLASGIIASAPAGAAESTSTKKSANAAAPSSKTSTASSKKTSRFPVGGMPESARTSYALRWGVDQFSAQLVQSGQLVRFSYRVMDTGKAGSLHDKGATPYLLDEKARAVLQVPIMEKVGPLRQAVAPEYGKSYWMVFSNKGNLVKAGHRVSVVIGQFRVDGLIVLP
jgi:hypothetical protein